MKALFLLGVLLLAACAPTVIEADTDTPIKVPSEPAAQEKPVDAVVQPDDVTPTGLDNLPTDIKSIIENAPKRVEDGFSYFYIKVNGGQAVNEKSNQAKIKQLGEVVRMELSIPPVYDRETYVDVVLLNTDDLSATGYCNKASVCGSKTPVERNVKYSDFAFPLPLEWYNKLEDATGLSGETLSGRMTYKISGTIDGVATLVWIDRFSGVPMQVQQGEVVYKYQDVALGVTAEELKP